MVTGKQIDIVTRHYLHTCLWADAPEGTNPRITKQAREKARTDCSAFIAACGPLFEDAMRMYDNGYVVHADAGSAEAAFGHDFWLTRSGHGCGFWDRHELGEELGDKLSALCGFGTAFPDPEPEFDRGWLYL